MKDEQAKEEDIVAYCLGGTLCFLCIVTYVIVKLFTLIREIL